MNAAAQTRRNHQVRTSEVKIHTSGRDWPNSLKSAPITAEQQGVEEQAAAQEMGKMCNEHAEKRTIVRLNGRQE